MRGQIRRWGQSQDLRRPLLRGAHRRGAEKQTDMGCARNFQVFRRAVISRGGQVGGIPAHGFQFEPSGDHQGMRRQLRRITEEELFGGNAVGREHRRGRNRDQARDRDPRRDSNSNRTSHRVPRENRAVRRNRAAREEFSHQGFAALFRACGRKWPWRAAVSWEVRCENAQPLLGEPLRQVRHDLFVCGNSVKEHDGALFRASRLLQNCGRQAAAAGVDEIDLLVVRRRNR